MTLLLPGTTLCLDNNNTKTLNDIYKNRFKTVLKLVNFPDILSKVLRTLLTVPSSLKSILFKASKTDLYSRIIPNIIQFNA